MNLYRLGAIFSAESEAASVAVAAQLDSLLGQFEVVNSSCQTYVAQGKVANGYRYCAAFRSTESIDYVSRLFAKDWMFADSLPSPCWAVWDKRHGGTFAVSPVVFCDIDVELSATFEN